jgi:hypothetical protein
LHPFFGVIPITQSESKPMDDTILAIYCLCDESLKVLGHREDPQRTMSGAEVMTTALVAARFFGGKQAHEAAARDRALPEKEYAYARAALDSLALPVGWEGSVADVVIPKSPTLRGIHPDP